MLSFFQKTMYLNHIAKNYAFFFSLYVVGLGSYKEILSSFCNRNKHTNLYHHVSVFIISAEKRILIFKYFLYIILAYMFTNNTVDYPTR